MMEMVVEKTPLSWFYETLKLFIQYLSVALIAVPTGLLCYTLIQFGLHQTAALIVSFSVGFPIAFCGWKYLNRYLFQNEMVKVEFNVFRKALTDNRFDLVIEMPKSSTIANTAVVVVVLDSKSPSLPAIVQFQNIINIKVQPTDASV